MAASDSLNEFILKSAIERNDLSKSMRQTPIERRRFHGLKAGEVLPDGNGGGYTSGGKYSKDEMETFLSLAQESKKKGRQAIFDRGIADDDEGADSFIKEFGGGVLQGVLFSNEKHDAGSDVDGVREDRSHAAASRTWVRNLNTNITDRSELKDKIVRGMTGSRMPNALMKGLYGDMIVESDEELRKKGMGGFYSPRSGDITVRSNTNGSGVRVNTGTILHELGHRADYRSHGSENEPSRENLPRVGDAYPNPREEGIADGFRERYQRSYVDDDTSFGQYEYSGYSTHYKGNPEKGRTDWTEDRRNAAIYAAARAHFSRTGENPTVESGDMDEYLHKMVNTSPHAVKALRETGLKDVGAKSFDSYRKLRKVGTQMSLLDPSHEYDIYDIPESHRKEK